MVSQLVTGWSVVGGLIEDVGCRGLQDQLGGGAAAIEKAAGGDAEKAQKAIAEGSQATAQALWYLAEYQFAAFEKIGFPEIKGKADMAKVNEWAQGPFVKWIEELYNRAVTGGCVSVPLQYFPTNPTNRQQMAAFLVKTFGLLLYGP